ncbi:MAG: PrgI family protein [Flavonifractor plautii]
MSSLEVRINKEVRDYQESLFFGLTLRQFIFALLAVAVAVGIYFGLRPVLAARWAGVYLAAFPFALGGFFSITA